MSDNGEKNAAAIEDISITVDNPEKYNTFFNVAITFRVISKVARSDFEKSEYRTHHQYDDFLKLRQELHEAYPCMILPPLLDYNNLVLLKSFDDVIDSQWMKQRLCSFNHFMGSLARHPLVSRDARFKAFITASQTEEDASSVPMADGEVIPPSAPTSITPPQKQHEDSQCCSPLHLSQTNNSVPSILGGMGSRFVKRLSKAFHENATALVLRGRSTEFQEYIDYGHKFHGVCLRLDRLGDHLTSELTSYAKILDGYVAFQDDWASLETANTDLIKREAQANAQLKSVLTAWIPRYKNSGFFVKNYFLYLDSMKDAMQSRDESQVEYELTRDEYGRRQKEVAQKLGKGGRWNAVGSFLGRKIFKNPGPARTNESDPPTLESAKVEPSGTFDQDNGRGESSIVEDFKRARSQLQMEGLELELEKNKMTSSQADVEYRQDFSHWHACMVKDFRSYFVDLAGLYVDLYTQNLKVLQTAVDDIPQITVTQDHQELPPLLINTET